MAIGGAPQSSQSDDFVTLTVKRPCLRDPPPKFKDNDIIENEEKDEEELDDPVEEEDEDDGSEGCPICFEPWTTSGFHRLVSLKCGHLFGKRCIDRWLSNATRTKCPQCNAPAKRSDVRILYAKKLIAMDTSEKDSLLKQLMEEREMRRLAIEAEARANVALQATQAQLESTMKDLDHLKRRLLTYDGLSNSEGFNSVPQFTFLKHIQLATQPNACRCMDFDPYYGMFLVSKAHHLGKGHGISKVSLLDNGSIEYIGGIHSDQIRCIAHSPFKDGLVLSTGNDKRLCLTTLSSNTVMQAYNLEAPGWSCAFDPIDSNKLYAGLANCSIACFDLRNTVEPVSTFRPELPRKLPIHTLIMTPEGLLGGTLDGPFLLDSSNGCLRWTWAPSDVKGSCVSVSLDAASGSVFSSYRLLDQPSVQFSGVFTASGLENVSSFPIESPQTIMSRSVVASYEDTELTRPLFFVPDEPTSAIHMYTQSGDSIKLATKMSTRAGSHLLDIKYGRTEQHGLVIGALSQTDLFVFTLSDKNN